VISEAIHSYKTWWKSLGPWQKLWPIAYIILYWGSFYFFGLLNKDHLIVGCALLFAAYSGDFPRQIFKILFPVALTFAVYQTQVLYADIIRGPIRVAEPYHFDLYFFGIETASGRMIPSEWFQYHTHAVLDFIAGVSYITYIANFVLIGFLFYFFIGRRRNQKKLFQMKTLQMMWAFFWTNVIGYSTYYWYPAAPPWYAEQYGLGPADPNAIPSAAGAARFDALLNVDVFSSFYAKSANVFGAIPSLHIAYPLIAVYFAFRLKALRSVAVINFLILCFSAVYLNHHYILDILWGMLYAILMSYLVERCALWLQKKGGREPTFCSLSGSSDLAA